MHNSTVPEGGTSSSNEEIISHAVATLTGDKTQWVVWQYLESDEGGKAAKVPYGRDGKAAKVSERDTWMTYSEAKSISGEYDLDGIGIVFDGSFLGVDLDNCVEDGVITDPQVEAFVSLVNTYTEISPSGTGLHLYFKLTGPYKAKKNRYGNYEVYTHNRYFTFTGRLFNQNLVRTVTPEEAEHVLKAIGYPWNPVKSAVDNVISGSSSNLDQEIAKEKMFSSKHGTEIEALYNGDTSAYGGDTSRADAALLKHAAYTFNGDREAMKQFWLESPLGQREKVQERPDYPERTVDFVLQDSSGSPAPELSTSYKDSSDTNKVGPKEIFTQAETDLEDFLKLDGKTDWLVEHLVTKESLNMIASPPAQGKTFMALNIALAVAFGQSLFGKFAVPDATNVLIVNEEDSENELSGRLQSMVPEGAVRDKIKLYCNTGLKVNKEWSEGLIERAKANNAGLVILDNLAVLSLANENDAQAVQEVMECFRQFTRAGITVIFIHHDRKGQPGEANGADLNSSRGSGVIPAAVHGYLSVRSAKNNTFVVSQRKLKANSPKVKDFVVQMHNNVTKDNGFRFEFEYIGEYDPDLNAAENLESRIMLLSQERTDGYYFTKKTLVSRGFAVRPDDKSLGGALKALTAKGLLKSRQYRDLPEAEKELVDDTVKAGNTTVYCFTEMSGTAQPDDSETHDVDELNIPF